MSIYGAKQDEIQFISGSAFLFPSGALADHTTAISASVPSIIAITCSNNENNKLTKLTTLNAYGIINIGKSTNENDFDLEQRIILRYVSASYTSNSIDLTNNTDTNLLFNSSQNAQNIIADIRILNNDDAFAVAFKTVNALQNIDPKFKFYSASLVDDGSSMLSLSSSLGSNMEVGSTFKVRSGSGEGTTGIFKIRSMASGGVAHPDFDGTKVQVGEMIVGDSFKVGGSEPSFSYNIIQSGSGVINQGFYPGNLLESNASIGLRLDPADKSSGLITGSNSSASLYFSSSGRIGLGTSNPTTDFDIRANDVKFRQREVNAGFILNKEGNLESFANDTNLAQTGSEVILKYSRGTTSGGPESIEPNLTKTVVNAGDVLGSVRWIMDIPNLNDRLGNEAASIKTIAVSADAEEGVAAFLSLQVARQNNQATTQITRIDEAGLEVSGNLELSGFISASGTVTANSFHGDGANLTNVTATATIPAGTYSSSLQTLGNVTSSGDISASGTITALSSDIVTINGGSF